jgi:hypothetical protein
MRAAAVALILIVVCWAAALALAGDPQLDAELAQASYSVAPPVTAAAVAPPRADASAAASTMQAYPLPADPAAAVRILNAVQVTPTQPPPVEARTGLHGLPLAPYGLTDCQTASFYRAQAGLPAVFDALTYRESRCQPNVGTWCCSGLLEIHELWIPRLAGCDVFVRSDLYDSQRNMCAASVVYAAQGINAWSTA